MDDYIDELHMIIDLTIPNTIIIPEHNTQINIIKLFTIFVNKKKLVEELIDLEIPNIQQLYEGGSNSTSILLKLLLGNFPLECFTNALINIRAFHIDNIICKVIEEKEVYSHDTNMQIAFSIHYNQMYKDILFMYFKENVDMIFIYSLLQYEMITNDIYEKLIKNIQNGNYVGKKLIKYIKYFCDDDIKEYWFPLINSDIVNILTN